MAWFTYRCGHCGREFKESLPKRLSYMVCKYMCGGLADNVMKPGTAIVYERLDNGAMAKAVERIHNVEELIDERAKESEPEIPEVEEEGETDT